MRITVFFNIVLLLSSLILISCESHEKNNINLSTKSLKMSAGSGSSVIYVNANGWWVNDVSVEGIRLYAAPEDIERDCERIEGEWFKIEKEDGDKLHVIVMENKSEQPRKMVMTIESENYFDYIDVYQEGVEKK